ncbi:ADAMTS-like protein 4 [Macrobrachium rosenbergii]|uniref:ADAMTS-like protein 4 n=1 Tax=Macrobrachium rosenbergii TaxID=79674 RepID=UPI0034D61669
MTSRFVYLLLVAAWSYLDQVAGDECLSCRSNPCRKVTGLFTRPTLPVGYNLIARVPTHACNLTVTELRRSSNYLAIRTDQGYIINGNWALVPPGRYMGAGTGFFYSRPHPPSEGGEVISTPGPLISPVDIMIIYQSPNQGVRYEYWHPLGPPFPPPLFYQPQPPAQSPPRGSQTARGRGHHQHRGHPRGPGSLQNVQPGFLQPPVNPDGSPGLSPGDYYGGASSTRVRPASGTQGVGTLVQDTSLVGIGEVGGTATGGTGPSWKVWKFTPCSRTCGGGQQQAVYICTGAGGNIMPEEVCTSPKPPPQTVRCNPRPCPPVWQLGEWSQCSATCGTGLMTRTWACVQVVSPTVTRAVPPSACPSPMRANMVPLTQPCTLAPCTRWEVTTWSSCSVECGTGLMTRHVSCRAEGQRVSDDQCNIQEMPPKQELCHGHSCAHHTWFYTDWSEECIGGCEDGIQTRRVWCSPGVNSVEGDCDQTTRPEESRPCARADACAAAWFTGPWMPCSQECGNGTTSREVVCVVFLRGTFRATLDIECNPETRPNDTQTCNPDPCPPHWYYTDWSPCSRTCGRGTKTRAVQCLDFDQRPSTKCSIAQKPPVTRTCTGLPCGGIGGLSSGSSGSSISSSGGSGSISSIVSGTGGLGSVLGASDIRQTSITPNDAGCVDRFKNCVLVQQARLCRYSYYRTVCCASCYLQ